MNRHFHWFPAATLLLSACGQHGVRHDSGIADSAPVGAVDIARIAEPEPRWEPMSQYGNPDSYEVFGKTYRVRKSSQNYRARGIASWYGTKFHGQRTSSGEPYDMYKFTAAHKTLPIPTYARVTNLENHRSIIVKINDRGPFHEGRIIDLSYVAAMKLGIAEKGTAPVEMVTITPPIKRIKTRTIAAVYLQTGAFSDATNAHRLRDKLNQAGLRPVQILPPDPRKSLDFYRVMLGPLESREKTDKLSDSLDKLGISHTRVSLD